MVLKSAIKVCFQTVDKHGTTFKKKENEPLNTLAINCDDGTRHGKTSKTDMQMLTSGLCCKCKGLVNEHGMKPSDQKQSLTMGQANVKEEH